MNKTRGEPTVLCKSAWNRAAKRSHVLAQEGFAPHAVKAGQTGLHGVSDDAVAKGNRTDVGTDGSNCAGCFVT